MWNNGALHWIYNKLHIKCEEFSYKKTGWKVYYKLIGFSKFPTYFYMKTLINYDCDMTRNNLTFYFYFVCWSVMYVITCVYVYKLHFSFGDPQMISTSIAIWCFIIYCTRPLLVTRCNLSTSWLKLLFLYFLKDHVHKAFPFGNHMMEFF